MSRGPGRIERTVSAAFDAEPDNAFTVEDLADRVYRGLNRVEKKHRVAILRAVNNLMRRREEISFYRSELLGGALVYFRHDNVMSYAMARLKADFLNQYRSHDTRHLWSRTESDIRAKLDDRKGRYHEYIQPGGAWWNHVHWWIAKHDAQRVGDATKLEEIDAEIEAHNTSVQERLDTIATVLQVQNRI